MDNNSQPQVQNIQQPANTEQPPVPKTEIPNQTLYNFITAAISVIFCVLKFILTIGWFTIMFFPAIIAYLVFYIKYGNMIANKVTKDKNDYIHFWLVSIFLLLFALFFTDFGDYGPPTQILKFIPYNITLPISLISAFFSIFFMVLSKIKNRKR